MDKSLAILLAGQGGREKEKILSADRYQPVAMEQHDKAERALRSDQTGFCK